MKTFINNIIPPNAINNDIYSAGILIVFTIYFIFKIKLIYNRLFKKSLLRQNKTIKKLKHLSWNDFEFLCAELFEKQGWTILGNNKSAGPDGGVDIHMKKNKIKAIVQCKRYSETKISVKILREMYGLMHEHNVDKAYIVTTSNFTRDCYKFAEGKEIELINGANLVKLIRLF